MSVRWRATCCNGCSLNAVPYGARFLPSSIDPTVPGGTTPLPDNFLRPIKGYGDIQLIESGGNSNYHSMQVQLNRRFSSSLSFGVSYTWSKAMDLVDGNNNDINPFIDPHVRNYGKAGFDRTHNFVVNYVYNIPSLSKYWDNGFSRAVFGRLGAVRYHVVHQRRAFRHWLCAGAGA